MNNLESHIRNCMALAMESVGHDTVNYYYKIKEIYHSLDYNAEELLWAIILNQREYGSSTMETIWLWAAIGELDSIKRIIDGRI